MTTNRRSKRSRARGTWTHGWGAKKKHRGAGHRGGRGNAGSGKLGDCKSPTYARIKDYFGRHGFISKSRTITNPINVGYLDTHVEKLYSEKMVEKKADVYYINCSKLGFNKLLSKGAITHKLEITVERAVESVIAKVESAGGKVICELKAEPEVKKAEAKVEVKKTEDVPKAAKAPKKK
ncbi:MAG: uL15m family ribosomal protein [Candidatus Woesearchaeota archaeon]|jgi:large subunit ribosomal protein L15